MNSVEEMKGTNRVVIKLEDNTKIIIERKMINERINYLLETNFDINYVLSDIGKECGYITLLRRLTIDEDIITVEGSIVENILLKEEYHIINGNELAKFTEAYTPCPEEVTHISPLTLCFDEIKEMTGDPEMLQEMYDENMLLMNHEDLIDLGISVKPVLRVVRNNNAIEENNEYKPELSIVKTKVKKK